MKNKSLGLTDRNTEKRGDSFLAVFFFLIILISAVVSAFSATSISVYADEFEDSLSAFPESYHDGLKKIHESFPNYIFEADYTGVNFYDFVDAQWAKKTEFDDYPSWKALYSSNYNWKTGKWIASEGHFTYTTPEVIAYYIDPRNWLNTTEIYTFMRQSNSENQTIEGLRSITQGTFLAKPYTPGKAADESEKELLKDGKVDYAEVIMIAAKESGVSPYVLASSIIQEQGADGPSTLASGNYAGADGTLKGYYNFYNIGATGGSSDDVIQNGLTYAKNHGWNSRYKSIVEGAEWYANGYINNNQDTYYYMDYNVLNGPDEYWHQYATTVYDMRQKGKILSRTYNSEAMKNAALVFRIPVYDNMPAERVPWVEENNKLNNYYFTDIDAEGLSPVFDMYTNKYTLSVDKDTEIGYSLPSGAVYKGKDSYQLKSGKNKVVLTVMSETGYTRDYVINVTASVKCTLKVKAGTVEKTYKTGDVDGNDKIDIIDLAKIQKHLLGRAILTGDAFKAADVNNSGDLDIIDLAKVQKYILGKIKDFKS